VTRGATQPTTPQEGTNVHMKLHKRTRRILAVNSLRQSIKRERDNLKSLVASCMACSGSEYSDGLYQGLKSLQGAIEGIESVLELWEV
jgi:hypothetical protein